MPDKKISELNSASAVYDADDFALVQDAETKQVNASVVKAYVKDGLSKSDVGLGNVDNTSDANKPVSTAAQTALDLKQDAASAATLTGTQTLTNKTISGSSNTLSNIANSSLTNSSITINGNAVSLGGSTTVSAATTNTLTIGTGLSGTSFNGSAAVTIAIDSTVVTLTGTQTLTNKTLTSPVISGGTANNVAIGGTTPAAGAFTTLSASSTVSGTGFSTYLASPPAIGNTTPAAGAFTTLSSTGNTTLGDASADTLTINAGTTTFAQGTANGVLYLNGSKVATSGSGLVFDGSKLGVTGTTPAYFLNESDQTTDEKNWDIISGSKQFQIRLVNDAYSSGVTAFNIVRGTGTDISSIRFNTGSGTERLRIDSAGNVGIGTSSTYSKLHLKQATNGSAVTGFVIENSANDNRLFQYFDGNYDEWRIGASYGSTGAFKPITWWTSDARRLTLDSSGNLGLGVTPSAWGGAYKAIQFGIDGVLNATTSTTNGVILAKNLFNNGTGNRYINTDFASFYQQISGQHQWYTAPSGTAGNAISFTQAMTLDASGNLLVGDTAATSTRLTLKAAGNGYTNGAIKIIGAVSGTNYITSVGGIFYISNDGTTESLILSAGNLTISGATATKASGTTWANPSDTRLKDNQQLYTKGLDELLRVVVKTWEYNGKGGSAKGTKGVGVIADEIEIILPESVDTYTAKLNSEDEYQTEIKRFDASEVIWLLVNGVKELHAEIETLKQRIH